MNFSSLSSSRLIAPSEGQDDVIQFKQEILNWKSHHDCKGAWCNLDYSSFKNITDLLSNMLKHESITEGLVNNLERVLIGEKGIIPINTTST